MDPSKMMVVLAAASVVEVVHSLVWYGKRLVFAWSGFFVVLAVSLFADLTTLGAGCFAAVWAGLSGFISRRKGDPAVGWLTVAVGFACCVGGLSNSSGSPGHLHEQIAAWLHISPEQAWHLVVGVRKTIHFSAYGLATLAAYRWSTANGAPGLWRGIAFTLPLACFDEFRQHFATGREGSPWDVALDMTGAATFLFIAWLIDRRHRAPAAA